MKQMYSHYLVVLWLLSNFLSFSTITAQQVWQLTNSKVDYPIYKFISHDDQLYAAFYGAGVYKTANEGEEWLSCHNGLNNFLVRDLVVVGNRLFVGTNRGGVFSSSDNGGSWQAANDEVLYKNIWSLAAIDNRLFAGTAKGLFYTDDAGGSWQKANLPRPKTHHQIIFSLGVKGRSIIAGSNEYIYLSEDAGVTWEQIQTPTTLDIMSVQVQNNTWLLGTSGDGILSSENGIEWQVWNKSTGNTRTLILTEQTLIAGSALEGVVDMQAGESFTNLNEGFTSNGASSPAIKSLGYHDGKLYAGTYKQGIWRYDIPKSTLAPPTTNTQKNWRDVNVFPNPTSDGIITLAYQLEESNHTHIELFDSYGKRIAQISPPIEQYKGTHQLNYDMNGLSGGTYYFHLQIGDQKITKQVVLIKQ